MLLLVLSLLVVAVELLYVLPCSLEVLEVYDCSEVLLELVLLEKLEEYDEELLKFPYRDVFSRILCSASTILFG